MTHQMTANPVHVDRKLIENTPSVHRHCASTSVVKISFNYFQVLIIRFFGWCSYLRFREMHS